MPRESRIQKIIDSYLSLDTDEQKIDFVFAQISYRMLTIDEKGVNHDEERLFSQLEEDIFQAKKRNEDGQEVFDFDRIRKAYRYFAKLRAKFEYDMGMEYKKHFDSINPDDPEREAKALFLAKNSVPAELYTLSQNIAGDLAMFVPDGFDGNMEISQYGYEERAALKATLSDEDKEYLDIGTELTKDPGAIKKLKHKTVAGVGLNPQDYETKNRENIDSIKASLNTNWLSDDTLNNTPIFVDPRLDSEYHKRMENHYLSLNSNEDKVEFFVNGAVQHNVKYEFKYNIGMERGVRLNELEDDITKTASAFSDGQKEEFERCLLDFLSPKTPKGELDYDEFERRVDMLVKKYADLKVVQGEFIQNCKNNRGENNSFHIPGAEIIGEFANENEGYVSEIACPEAIKAESLKKCLTKLLEDHKLNNDAMHEYCNRKHVFDQNGGVDQFLEAFESYLVDYANDLDIDARTNFDRAYSNHNRNLNAEQDRILNEYGNKVNASLVGTSRNENKWDEPWKNITIDDLKKMSNLYSQMEDADHWYHHNSGEFNQLLGSMKAADDLYKQIGGQGRMGLTEGEKRRIQNMFDNIRTKSTIYLADKAEKERGTDLGKERYEIALSALDVASHGKAKQTVEFHNTHRVKKGKVSIMFNQLNERKAQSSDERKEALKNRRDNVKANAAAPEIQGPGMGRRNN